MNVLSIMLKWAILLVSLCLEINSIRNKKFCNVSGYYWKDYINRPPEDALPCGRDGSKKPIFVGQTVLGKYLIPGKIYKNYPAIYIAHGGEHIFKDKFKILCTANPQFFEWIPTNNSQLLKIKDKHLVIGGYDPSCPVFIGRTRVNDELVPGKLTACSSMPVYFGLRLCINNSCKYYHTYEVLSYNPGY